MAAEKVFFDFKGWPAYKKRKKGGEVKKKMGGFNGRNICFTINNPTSQLIFDGKEIVRYAVWQYEVDESGTYHFQGYIEFNDKMTMHKIKDIIGKEAHIEGRKGTRDQARNYAMKEDTRVQGPWEFGKWNEKGSGHRSDLEAVVESIKKKLTLEEIVDEHTVQYIKYNRGIERTMNILNNDKRDWVMNVYWYYGETGAGKTRAAVEESGGNYWMSGKNLKWWDGYEGHENVIIDDFRKDFCTFHELLRILDRYPYTVEVKGGTRELLAKNLWITSPKHPSDVYETNENLGQLLRRITKIKKFEICEIFENPAAAAEVAGNTNAATNFEDDLINDLD